MKKLLPSGMPSLFIRIRCLIKLQLINLPWVSINSNNKMIGRLTSLRYLLIKTEYENKKILKPSKYSKSLANYSATIEGVTFENLTYEQFMIISKYSDDT